MEHTEEEWIAAIQRHLDGYCSQLQATPRFAWLRRRRLRNRIATGEQALVEIERIGFKEYRIRRLAEIE